jgi:hypothetical protein
MKLPNGDRAIIPPAKLADYLLSDTHPVGRSKTKFLRGVGFNEANADLLGQGLLRIARRDEVVASESSLYGVKYVVDGTLATPSGRHVRLRTVWIVEPGLDRPRFVTAYPA